ELLTSLLQLVDRAINAMPDSFNAVVASALALVVGFKAISAAVALVRPLILLLIPSLATFNVTAAASAVASFSLSGALVALRTAMAGMTVVGAISALFSGLGSAIAAALAAVVAFFGGWVVLIGAALAAAALAVYTWWDDLKSFFR